MSYLFGVSKNKKSMERLFFFFFFFLFFFFFFFFVHRYIVPCCKPCLNSGNVVGTILTSRERRPLEQTITATRKQERKPHSVIQGVCPVRIRSESLLSSVAKTGVYNVVIVGRRQKTLEDNRKGIILSHSFRLSFAHFLYSFIFLSPVPVERFIKSSLKDLPVCMLFISSFSCLSLGGNFDLFKKLPSSKRTSFECFESRITGKQFLEGSFAV